MGALSSLPLAARLFGMNGYPPTFRLVFFFMDEGGARPRLAQIYCGAQRPFLIPRGSSQTLAAHFSYLSTFSSPPTAADLFMARFRSNAPAASTLDSPLSTRFRLLLGHHQRRRRLDGSVALFLLSRQGIFRVFDCRRRSRSRDDAGDAQRRRTCPLWEQISRIVRKPCRLDPRCERMVCGLVRWVIWYAADCFIVSKCYVLYQYVPLGHYFYLRQMRAWKP